MFTLEIVLNIIEIMLIKIMKKLIQLKLSPQAEIHDCNNLLNTLFIFSLKRNSLRTKNVLQEAKS